MKRVTSSVLFYVKRNKELKNGNIPIYARVTINGKRAEFSTQIDISEQAWDSNKGMALGNSKKAKEINQHLELIKLKLREHRIHLEQDNEEITAENVKNRYLGIDCDVRTLLEVFDEHNLKCQQLVGKDYSPLTAIRYRTCRNHVSEFIKNKYKKKDIRMTEVTHAFIKDFEFYLKTARNIGHNSTVRYIKNLRKIVNMALANNWLKTNPFANITYHLEEVDMDYLTEEELHRMMSKRFSNERIENVKNIYLFCCFTGLAFIDVKQLVIDDITEKDGKYWIRKKRQKTKNLCVVPLLPPAVELMKIYKTHPKRIEDRLVLPVLSNQKMNAYLKEIADLCGINKNLSTHTARHTFATTVTLANQVSMEVVSKMLGHSNINMTKKYARVVDELINKDMEKVYNKYSDIRKI
jgi:site-specific recombinase XerD